MGHHRPSYAHFSNGQLAATAATAAHKRKQIKRDIAALQREISALKRQDNNHWRQWALADDLLRWRTRSGETSRDIFVEYEALKRLINDETPEEEHPILSAFEGTWQEPKPRPKRRRGKKNQAQEDEQELPGTWRVCLTWPDGRVTTLDFDVVHYVHGGPQHVGKRIIILHTEGGYTFRVRDPERLYGEASVCGSILNITHADPA